MAKTNSLADVSVDAEGETRATLCREDSRVNLVLEELSASEQTGILAAGLSKSSNCISISVGLLTPEAVGLSWEILAAINLNDAADVWISDKMYGEASLRSFAPSRPLNLRDGDRGYLLKAKEFSQLLDVRG